MDKNNYIFYRYFLLLWVLMISFPNSSVADYWSDRRDAVTGGIKDPVGTVINESKRIGDQISTYLGQGLTPPIVREYFTYLENQGNGRWKALPDRLQYILTPKYDKVILSEVRYAENIDTIHGQAITVGNNIYFPQSINLNNPTDIPWLLHELEHVSQYNAHGGKEAFVVKYLVNGALQIGRNGSINIHDAINLERDAENKAIRIQEQVSREWTAQPVQPQPQTRRPITQSQPQQIQPKRQQPVPFQPTMQFTDSCVIYGLPFLINTAGAIFSSSQGYAPAGQKVAPTSPYCLYDLLNNKGRYCVNQNGQVFFGTPQVVGICRPCTVNGCN